MLHLAIAIQNERFRILHVHVLLCFTGSHETSFLKIEVSFLLKKQTLKKKKKKILLLRVYTPCLSPVTFIWKKYKHASFTLRTPNFKEPSHLKGNF